MKLSLLLKTDGLYEFINRNIEQNFLDRLSLNKIAHRIQNVRYKILSIQYMKFLKSYEEKKLTRSGRILKGFMISYTGLSVQSMVFCFVLLWRLDCHV